MSRQITATARTEIQAPPDAVFLWATDPERVTLWVSDLVESRPLRPGEPLRVGARAVEVLKVGGKLVEVPSEVTSLQPDRLIENSLETPDGPCRIRTDICPGPAGCAVTQTMVASLAGTGWLPSFLIRGLVTTRLQGDLKRLKSLVERS